MNKDSVKLTDDLISLGIYLPIECGFYSVNDILESNLNSLSSSMRESVIDKMHSFGLKFDSELTIEEMQARTDLREALDFGEIEMAKRIDFTVQNIDSIDDFYLREKQFDFAMKKLPNTDFIDKEEAEAWLALVDKNRKLMDDLEIKNKKIMFMLKNRMDISLLKKEKNDTE